MGRGKFKLFIFRGEFPRKRKKTPENPIWLLICYCERCPAVEKIERVPLEEDLMKKTTKTAAVKSATNATPATPAPSPVKKTKTANTSKSENGSSSAQDIATATAPVVKTSSAKSRNTTVVAQIDVGFGNTLYLRGDGPGLSWEKGVALDCVADDKWSIALSETSRPIVFKFLVNDLTWSAGDDYVAQPGATVNVTPSF